MSRSAKINELVRVIGAGLSGQVATLIKQVVAEEMPTAVQHPFGFTVFNLGQTETQGARLRLHIWHPLSNRAQPAHFSIHNHVYSFRSLILTGGLRESRFTCVAAKNQTAHRFMSVRYSEGASVLEPEDEFAEVTSVENSDYQRGSQYLMPAGIFHCTASVGEITATLVLASPPCNQSAPRVIGPGSQITSVRFERQPVAREIANQMLQDLFEAAP